MCVVSVMKSFIEGLVELAYFALLYDHLVASVMKLAIPVIESAFRLHSDSAILSAVSVMIFANFGSTNNLFPLAGHAGWAAAGALAFFAEAIPCRVILQLVVGEPWVNPPLLSLSAI